MFETPIQITGAVLTLAITALVFLRPVPGSRPLAAANLLAYVASPIVQTSDLLNPQWSILVVDVTLLIVATIVLIRHPGWWIRIAWAAMGLTVLTHVAMALDLTLRVRGYVSTLYLVYFVFLAGLAFSILEKRSQALSAEPSAP